MLIYSQTPRFYVWAWSSLYLKVLCIALCWSGRRHLVSLMIVQPKKFTMTFHMDTSLLASWYVEHFVICWLFKLISIFKCSCLFWEEFYTCFWEFTGNWYYLGSIDIVFGSFVIILFVLSFDFTSWRFDNFLQMSGTYEDFMSINVIISSLLLVYTLL